MIADFTAEEISEFHWAFELHDEDKDNTISLAQLEKAMQSLSQHLPESELAQLFAETDGDKDGLISETEFLKLLAKLFRNPNAKQELAEAFNVLDQDHDGLISIAELHRVLLKTADCISKDDLNEIIGANTHDKIDYEEFSRILQAR